MNLSFTLPVWIRFWSGALLAIAADSTLTAASPAPTITSKLSVSGQVGVAFTYQITANRNPAVFGASPLPAGLVVAATGSISGTPSASGIFEIVLTATNNTGVGTATLTLNVLPQKPVITSAATAGAEIGVAFQYQIVASNSPTSFNATGLPAGLTVNTSSGLIAGTPSVVGNKSVVLTAINAGGSGTATLVITTTVAKPVITSPSAATGRVGQAFQFQITGTNSPTSFSATGLPAGLVVNTATGLITGTPSVPGSSQVTVGATNAGGTGNGIATFTFTSAAPVITSALTIGGQTGVALSYAITATQQPSTFGAIGLPPGLAINTSSGLITGIPSVPGNTLVTITATNNGGTGSAVLELQISAGLPYTTDFEVTEGYALAPLNGQLGWVASSGVAIANTDATSGTARVQLNPGASAATMSRDFASGGSDSIVYIDFFAKPAVDNALADSSTYSPEGSRWSFQRVGANAVLHAFTGNGAGGGAWVSTGFALPLAGDLTAPWIRLTARTNFGRKKWDLYADSQMVAADLSLLNVSTTHLGSFHTTGGLVIPAGLDDFYAGATNPLFTDANNNGIEDTWETSHGLSLTSDNRDLSPSGNGLSVVQAYVRKLDPNDFYSGSAPTLTVVGGDHQTANPGEFNALPFDVAVWNSGGTTALPNAPVTFTVIQGGGQLALSNTSGASLSTALSLRTDVLGTAQVFYQQPTTAGINSLIQVTAGTSSMSFLTSSNDGTDTDGDGLTDAWELQYLATKSFSGEADPGSVGRTLLESFAQGLSPWPVPSVSADLRIWFRAELGVTKDVNGRVENWVDLSGHGTHLIQTSPVLQPVWTPPSVSRPAVLNFDGSQWLRSLASNVFGSNPDVTVLLVIAPESIQLEHAVVAGMGGDWAVGPLVEYIGGVAANRFGLVSSVPPQPIDGLDAAVGLVPEQFQVVEYVKASGILSSFIDGTFQGAEVYDTLWADASRSFVIGGLPEANYGFRGKLAELRIYNRALSPAERIQVESELATHYGLPGGQIVDSDGDGLSDAEEVVLGTNKLVPDHPDVALEVTLPAKNTTAR